MQSSVENWLCLDLSTSHGTLSIHGYQDGRVTCLGQRVIGESFDHSENLISTLEATLAEVKLTFGELDRYVTTSGPGSFTGLRIAFSTFKAFSFISNKPIDNVSGSEARFLAWLETQGSAKAEWDVVLVLSPAAAQKFVVVPFQRSPAGWEKKEEVVVTGLVVPGFDGKVAVLTDVATARMALQIPDVYQSFHFPLEASHLATALPFAKTRRTSTTLEEWVSLSPEYFGTTKLVESGKR